MLACWLLCGVFGAAANAEPDTLVLCPPHLQAALQPWLAHRQGHGHEITLARPAATTQAIEQQISDAASHGSLQYVVLIGNSVPTAHVPAKVNVQWGSEAEIATDGPYADLDDDGLPDVAIGRIPVDSPGELATIVRKIIQYEEFSGHGLWRRQMNIVAGLGGFGVAADVALQVAARMLIEQGVPAGYHTRLTHASWRSPYCPPPWYFRDCTMHELSSGCLFWVYLGHGQRTLLDDVRVPSGRFPILSNTDIRKLRPQAASVGSPLALLVACYSGAFDGPDDCIGEALLTSRDGPVAVIGASRVTLPYGNAVFCAELMKECFTHRRATLGELVLHAKRSSVEERPDDACRRALDLLANLLSPSSSSLLAERREHALLYNLLGDPLLAMAHSQEIEVRAPATASPGETILVRGISPLAGRCTLELVSDRGQLTFAPPQRERYEESRASELEFVDTYRRANDPRLASLLLDVAQGEFAATLAVPEDARGTCYVRAFVAGSMQHALGAAKVLIQTPARD